MPRVNWSLTPEAKAIFEAYKEEKGLGQDDAANEMLLEFSKSISLDRLSDYCQAYDEIYGNYPESEWEGNDVVEFVLECEGLL
jgi:hypothetical protein